MRFERPEILIEFSAIKTFSPVQGDSDEMHSSFRFSLTLEVNSWRAKTTRNLRREGNTVIV
jgi:hypothetical protein